jgi:hypothetical protein
MGDIQQAISTRAYELWEQEGRPDGRDLAHWLAAELSVQLEATEREAGKAPVSVSATPQRGAGARQRPAMKRSHSV